MFQNSVNMINRRSRFVKLWFLSCWCRCTLLVESPHSEFLLKFIRRGRTSQLIRPTIRFVKACTDIARDCIAQFRTHFRICQNWARISSSHTMASTFPEDHVVVDSGGHEHLEVWRVLQNLWMKSSGTWSSEPWNSRKVLLNLRCRLNSDL